MDYLPVFLLLLAAAGIGLAAITISYLIGPRRPHPMKDQPFECGVPTYGTTRQRVSVRFYLVAILFLIFDVEAVFFFPWAISFRKFLPYGSFIIIEMALFVGILLIGYYYVLRKKALEWD